MSCKLHVAGLFSNSQADFRIIKDCVCFVEKKMKYEILNIKIISIKIVLSTVAPFLNFLFLGVLYL